MHTDYLMERRAAFASTLHHLHQMLLNLRWANQYNLSHGLNLNLPADTAIVDLIGACVDAYQNPAAKVRHDD